MADGNRTRTPRRFHHPAGMMVSILAFGVALFTSGCSLIGLGIGGAVEAGRSKAPLHLTSVAAANLKPGSALMLVMTDSSAVTGVLLAPQPRRDVDPPGVGLHLARLRPKSRLTLDTLFVPLEQIAYARTPRPRHAALHGFTTGLKVDLIVIGVVGGMALLFLLVLAQSGYSMG